MQTSNVKSASHVQDVMEAQTLCEKRSAASPRRSQLGATTAKLASPLALMFLGMRKICFIGHGSHEGMQLYKEKANGNTFQYPDADADEQEAEKAAVFQAEGSQTYLSGWKQNLE